MLHNNDNVSQFYTKLYNHIVGGNREAANNLIDLMATHYSNELNSVVNINNKHTFLSLALKSHQYEIAEKLLELQHDNTKIILGVYEENNETLLHLAINDENTFLLLLAGYQSKYKASKNKDYKVWLKTDLTGNTLLHAAIRSKKLNSIKKIIDLYLDEDNAIDYINYFNKAQLTPLDVVYGQPDIEFILTMIDLLLPVHAYATLTGTIYYPTILAKNGAFINREISRKEVVDEISRSFNNFFPLIGTTVHNKPITNHVSRLQSYGMSDLAAVVKYYSNLQDSAIKKRIMQYCRIHLLYLPENKDVAQFSSFWTPTKSFAPKSLKSIAIEHIEQNPQVLIQDAIPDDLKKDLPYQVMLAQEPSVFFYLNNEINYLNRIISLIEKRCDLLKEIDTREKNTLKLIILFLTILTLTLMTIFIVTFMDYLDHNLNQYEEEFSHELTIAYAMSTSLVTMIGSFITTLCCACGNNSLAYRYAQAMLDSENWQDIVDSLRDAFIKEDVNLLAHPTDNNLKELSRILQKLDSHQYKNSAVKELMALSNVLANLKSDLYENRTPFKLFSKKSAPDLPQTTLEIEEPVIIEIFDDIELKNYGGKEESVPLLREYKAV